MKNIIYSDCHGAPAIPDADNEVSDTLVCTDCWGPCGTGPQKDDRTDDEYDEN